MYEHQFMSNLYANNTVCPRSSDPILHSRLPYKMCHYFLDIPYIELYSYIACVSDEEFDYELTDDVVGEDDVAQSLDDLLVQGLDHIMTEG